MTKIIFITSGKINYKFEGKSLYESIKLTASGKRFPHLEKDGQLDVFQKIKLLKKYKPVFIFCATSNQCMETGKKISKCLSIPLLNKKYLLPLRFDLSKFFDEKSFHEFNDYKFVKLRKNFIENFFEDKLKDPKKEIANRFRLLIKDASKLSDGKNIVVVSHAYLIKLFSIYYKVGDRIYTDKRLLLKLFNPKVEPMKRLETLILEM